MESYIMRRFTVLLVGIVFLVIGIFLSVKSASMAQNCTVEAKATVIEIKEEFSADSDGSGYMYYPIIEYKAGDKDVKVKLGGASSPAYDVGQKIDILYNPNDTTEIIVKGEIGLNVIAIILIVLGVLISGYGVIVLLKRVR